MVQYRAGARHESKRLGTNPFEAGDTFNVEFDMSQFDDNDPDDVAMKARCAFVPHYLEYVTNWHLV